MDVKEDDDNTNQNQIQKEGTKDEDGDTKMQDTDNVNDDNVLDLHLLSLSDERLLKALDTNVINEILHECNQWKCCTKCGTEHLKMLHQRLVMASDCVKHEHWFMGAGVGGIPCAPDNVIVPKAWKTEFLKFCEKLTKWRKERVVQTIQEKGTKKNKKNKKSKNSKNEQICNTA